jgi:hypothetical protein
MGGLNLHLDDENSGASSEKKKWNKSPKLILGLAVLIAIPVLGTTLAGSITVNSGSGGKINFGQGQTQAVACDNDVTITPYAVYAAGKWLLETITVTNLDTQASGCQGKNITVAAYDGSNNTISASATTFQPSGTAGAITPSTSATWGGAVTVSQTGGATATGTETIVFASGANLTDTYTSVSGFTIQQN